MTSADPVVLGGHLADTGEGLVLIGNVRQSALDLKAALEAKAVKTRQDQVRLQRLLEERQRLLVVEGIAAKKKADFEAMIARAREARRAEEARTSLFLRRGRY